MNLQLRTNLPALTCTAVINGKAIELLVDTAGIWSCVDEKASPEFLLKPRLTQARVSGSGNIGGQFLSAATAGSFRIGEFDLGESEFAVMNLGLWNLAAKESALPEVQGILGGSELARFRAVIDCSELTLSFRQPQK